METRRDPIMLTSAYERVPVSSMVLALRMCLLGLALCTLSYLYFSTGEVGELEGQTLFVVLAILFGISAISGFSVMHSKNSTWLQVAELLVDSIVITGVIYLSGGPVSPLVFLYLPFLIIITLTAGKNIAFLVAGFSILLYSNLIYALSNNKLSLFWSEKQIELTASELTLHITGLSIAMLLMVAVSEYFLKVIQQSNNKFISSLSTISALQEQQERLFDEIPTGIVLIDNSNLVTQMNKTAELILSSQIKKFNDINFNQLWKDRTGTEWENWELNLKNTSSAEISFCERESKKTTHLVVARKNLQHSNNSTGSLILLQDVTQLRELESQLVAQDQISTLFSSPTLPHILRSSKLEKFVAESPKMRMVLESIRKLTSSNVNVLITGESGTGKELIAKALHYEGALANQAFVAVNCGAIPHDLIESQLFGHKKGSFTGAIADQRGFFEQANGGTIFLDEIGELPLNLQTKLLRVIQERVIRAVGSEKDLPINVRIVAATNKDLQAEVERGNFREDLLYRINVVNITLPPLRDRKEDLPQLVKGVLSRLIGKEQPFPSISAGALKLLLDYNYPGNIRELENILERAYVYNPAVILPENLQIETTAGGATNILEAQVLELENLLLPANLEEILNAIERRYLEAAIQSSAGSKKQAAQLLGINFRSIRYRLDKYGIDSISNEP